MSRRSLFSWVGVGGGSSLVSPPCDGHVLVFAHSHWSRGAALLRDVVWSSGSVSVIGELIKCSNFLLLIVAYVCIDKDIWLQVMCGVISFLSGSRNTSDSTKMFRFCSRRLLSALWWYFIFATMLPSNKAFCFWSVAIQQLQQLATDL